MNVYVMRHGQTNYNELGLCNDNPSVDVHLTETGIAQAEAAEKTLTSIPLSRIYVSELSRTKQTANIVNRNRGIPTYIDARLNEIKTGFDGKPAIDYFAETGHDRYNFSPPGGESIKEFQDRVAGFITELRTVREQSTLIVTHEETLKVFTAYFEDLSADEMMSLNYTNCEIIKYPLLPSVTLNLMALHSISARR